MAKRVLIIEDERTLSDSLSFAFSKEGFDVRVEHDGAAALSAYREVRPDLVLLDLMLPGMSGEDICRAIRKEDDTPIIILSAKDSETDKVVLLELGADDYVTKPFSLREVIARARSLLRRAAREPKIETGSDVLTAGPLSLDEAAHKIRAGAVLLDLTPKEFELLALFMKNNGRVLTPDIILDRVWGYDYVGSPKAVNVYVKKLREKLGDHAGLIKTVRGVGYSLEVD